MDNQDIQKQLEEQQKALAMIYKSVEKTRKMIFWSGVATLVTFVLPLIIVIFMFPKMIDTFTGGIGALGDGNGGGGAQVQVENLSDTLNSLKELGF